MSMLKPLGDGIAVELIEKHAVEKNGTLGFDVRVSDGGVALPDIVDNPQCEGVVRVLGPGRSDMGITKAFAERIAETLWSRGILTRQDDIDPAIRAIIDVSHKPKPFDLKIGDRVIFQPHAMTSVPVDGKEMQLITERDVLAVFADG
jgi:co-chaperonin GroES (HSP10)